MINKKRKTITAEQKARIISESYATGCVASQLARSYGISEKTLYGWRTREKLSKKNGEASNNSDNKFVELAVQEKEYTILKKS